MSFSLKNHILNLSSTSASASTSSSLSSSFIIGLPRYSLSISPYFSASLCPVNSEYCGPRNRRLVGDVCVRGRSNNNGKYDCEVYAWQSRHLMSRNSTAGSRCSFNFRVQSAGPEADSKTEASTTSPIVSSAVSVAATSADDPFKDASESDSEVDEDDEAFPDVEGWDVLGLGQAMVDFSGVVDDGFLESLGLEKGTRKLVNHEERGKVLRAMDGCSYKAAAGGSLSNSLVALARLGIQPVGGPVLNVAMAGSVGSDPLGGFYRAKLRRASVNFLSAPVKDGTTGTVIVLTTPDAQRTMLAYQGTSSTINYDPGLSSIISKTNILVIEGYLFELPDTIRAITRACKDAHSNGALVAVTASDVSCIERHYDDFWEIIGSYADIIFANSDEARSLCNFSLKESPVSATRYLSHFIPLVSVTDGPRGSYIGARGEAIYIPPSPCVPVDTCGAGDAYASGILYGILRGVSDFKDLGTLAARIAAVVVGQQGTRLRVQDAIELAESFAFHLQDSAI